MNELDVAVSVAGATATAMRTTRSALREMPEPEQAARLSADREATRALTECVPFNSRLRAADVVGVSYPSDLTDEQWVLLERLLVSPGKPGRKHADLRTVVNGIFYITHTGCQWRFLPAEFGAWTRVWSQFRRWNGNGTWVRALAGLHAQARRSAGRAADKPSMVVVDTHLARGASNGGTTFHAKGGPYGRTNGAKRVVAVDVTGLPLAALVVPASCTESVATELLLEQLDASGQADRLELVLVDRGTSAKAARALAARFGVEVRRVGWETKSPTLRPIPFAWRVEVAHGRLGRSRRLAKSFENTTLSATGWLQVACLRGVLAAC